MATTSRKKKSLTRRFFCWRVIRHSETFAIRRRKVTFYGFSFRIIREYFVPSKIKSPCVAKRWHNCATVRNITGGPPVKWRSKLWNSPFGDFTERQRMHRWHRSWELETNLTKMYFYSSLLLLLLLAECAQQLNKDCLLVTRQICCLLLNISSLPTVKYKCTFSSCNPLLTVTYCQNISWKKKYIYTTYICHDTVFAIIFIISILCQVTCENFETKCITDR